MIQYFSQKIVCLLHRAEIQRAIEKIYGKIFGPWKYTVFCLKYTVFCWKYTSRVKIYTAIIEKYTVYVYFQSGPYILLVTRLVVWKSDQTVANEYVHFCTILNIFSKILRVASEHWKIFGNSVLGIGAT